MAEGHSQHGCHGNIPEKAVPPVHDGAKDDLWDNPGAEGVRIVATKMDLSMV